MKTWKSLQNSKKTIEIVGKLNKSTQSPKNLPESSKKVVESKETAGNTSTNACTGTGTNTGTGTIQYYTGHCTTQYTVRCTTLYWGAGTVPGSSVVVKPMRPPGPTVVYTNRHTTLYTVLYNMQSTSRQFFRAFLEISRLSWENAVLLMSSLL